MKEPGTIKKRSESEQKKNTSAQQQKKVKFNRQIVLRYMQKEKNQISALRAYFSSRFNQQRSISQSINVINAQIQNFFLRERGQIQNKKRDQPTIKDKMIAECLKNFGKNQKQSQLCIENAQLISENILKWIQQASKILIDIQEPLKQIQRKSIKNTVTQKQVDDFKAYLKVQMVKFKRHKQLIMQNYITETMRGDCQMLSILSQQIKKYKEWTL